MNLKTLKDIKFKCKDIFIKNKKGIFLDGTKFKKCIKSTLKQEGINWVLNFKENLQRMPTFKTIFKSKLFKQPRNRNQIIINGNEWNVNDKNLKIIKEILIETFKEFFNITKEEVK